MLQYGDSRGQKTELEYARLLAAHTQKSLKTPRVHNGALILFE